jgi:hypothetical protein
MSDAIKIVDNFFSDEIHQSILQYCLNSSYTYGESDNLDTPPTGMISNIFESSEIYGFFNTKISEKFTEVLNKQIYRMYINCFAPSENPYFHIDGSTEDITFLYYPNMSWNCDDGGETQILIDNQIIGILPLPNRIVRFDASLLHKATSFRNQYRFTIAIKYN